MIKKDINANMDLKAQNIKELINNKFSKLLELIKIYALEQIRCLEILDVYGHGENTAIKSRRRKDKYASNYQISHNFGETFVSFDVGFNVNYPITLKLEIKDEKVIGDFIKLNSIQYLYMSLWSDVSTYESL